MLNLQSNAIEPLPGGLFHPPDPDPATVKYPDGWTAASALPPKVAGSTYSYEPTNYEMLVDSPVFAGPLLQELGADARASISTSSPTIRRARRATPEHDRRAQAAGRPGGQAVRRAALRQLRIPARRSPTSWAASASSITARPRTASRLGYFTDWNDSAGARNLLPHEFTHSWDGKFRRGADLWTPDFRTPMRDSLLWVYEGQTQFWGYVLQARVGAGVASRTRSTSMPRSPPTSTTRRAASWRPLVDTTNDPIISAAGPRAGPASSAGGLLQRRPAGLDGSRFDPAQAVEGHEVDRRFRHAPSSASTTATGAR